MKILHCLHQNLGYVEVSAETREMGKLLPTADFQYSAMVVDHLSELFL